MIRIHLSLNNPWYKNKFKNIWNKSKLITKHKAIEVEITYSDYELAELSLEATVRQAHSGVDFAISLFGYGFRFNFYDTRHWNHIKGEWERYDNDIRYRNHIKGEWEKYDNDANSEASS